MPLPSCKRAVHRFFILPYKSVYPVCRGHGLQYAFYSVYHAVRVTIMKLPYMVCNPFKGIGKGPLLPQIEANAIISASVLICGNVVFYCWHCVNLQYSIFLFPDPRPYGRDACALTGYLYPAQRVKGFEWYSKRFRAILEQSSRDRMYTVRFRNVCQRLTPYN